MNNSLHKAPKVTEQSELITKLEKLNFPEDVVVTSASAIKVETVKKAFAELFPKKKFNIVGVKANSNINEQPVGIEETKLGAKNRIESAESIIGKTNTSKVFVSIENGIFITGKDEQGDDIYEDKAIMMIKFPDGKIYSSLSPRGVKFPKEAVKATLAKEGGFKNHTVGSTIAEQSAEKGITIDKQDPHSFLTNNEFSRQDQMISAIQESLLTAASDLV